jgi:3-methyladenine DNA glycosylase/8-oxoguanine DNA glycosylase
LSTSFIPVCHHSFDLKKTVLAHGWFHLAPYCWDPIEELLTHCETFGGQFITWVVSQNSLGSLLVNVSEELGVGAEAFVGARVRRALMLDWNPEPSIAVADQCEPEVANFLRAGGGRFLRGSIFYEDFVKTICTINTTWKQTVGMVDRIVSLVGGKAFPTPLQVIETRQLLTNLRLGYRASVLLEATERLLSSGMLTGDGNTVSSQVPTAELLKLKGIGPYAANHLAVLQCDYSNIPYDSEVRSYCLEHFGLSDNKTDDLFACWGEHRFLGYKLSRMLKRTNWTGE